MRAVLKIAAIFAVLLGIAAVAAWLADRPGAIAVEWLGYRIETSVGVLLVALVLLVAVLAALGRLILLVSRGPRILARRRELKRRRQGELALVRGLVAVAAGDARDAKKQAVAAEGATEGSPLALLLAAQAAQLNGDMAAAERAYHLMLENDETKFLGLRGLIVMARRRGDNDTALARAREAQALRPGAPWVASEIFGLQAALGEWRAAEETLVGALRHKLIDNAEGKRHRAVVLVGQADAALARGDTREALSLAETAHTLAPGLIAATTRLARLLATSGKLRKAERLIENAWGESPHPDLADAYAAIAPEASEEEKAKRLQTLAAINPGARESRLLAAEQSLNLRQWAVAREALMVLVTNNEATRRTFDLLAELERREKGDERRAAEWHEKANSGEGEPRWFCDACGHTPAAWAPHCPACHSFDSLHWRAPGAITEILPPPTAPADGTLPAAPVVRAG
ncbi:heme biosynthesis protein HemY [Zavarzinia compransoris]|uniref:Heme biosynthesis protein HemY n=1 Tax=Zavarzinia compransoris TaxID=1264899 RepID=A0A317DW05_9PROT|nr:heme biosynthesis HemY N-terminal domain-containing protein [Zavarzinia compransoris]PWR18869.1 heme biosynthesis protein HemY [Zavarzinia compransoris]TDP48864.1 HemY protein [Zavarzinia compransoris]